MTLKKPSKRQDDPTIKILPRGAKAPDHLLANAELEFHSGLLAGMRLNGIALWRARSEKDSRRFVSVTLPNRRVQDGGEMSYYDYLRGKGDDYKRLKEAIRARFREYARENGIDVPEDSEAAAEPA